MRIGVSVGMFLVTVGLVACLSTSTVGQQPPAKKDGGPFPTLIADLKASPGCLGVEVAKTDSGKNVIFAWFENKEALLKWYHSDTHRTLMKDFFPDQKFRKPLQNIPDGGGPILAVASITFADRPKFQETTLPISQIAIELYQPLAGGTALGGTFAPAKMKIPGLRDYSAKEKK